MNDLKTVSDSIFYAGADNISGISRDNPSEQFINSVRAAYPTESEYDRMLTRKMERRDSGPYQGIGVDQISESLQNFLSAHIKGEFSVSNQRWLSGGASKLQLAFTLEWDDPQLGRTKTELCVRLDPSESLNATSKLREYQILTAVKDAVPVPEPYWVDDDGSWFPEPALIYGFVKGSTKPREGTARVSGTGMSFPEHLRGPLGDQFVSGLAAIHSTNWAKKDLSAFSSPQVDTSESAIWQLNRVRRVWEEDRGEDWPLVEYVANWLEDNAPILDTASLLHGDYRSGNFLFDEDSAKISAWLDWERGYIGDRHRDLAWTTLRIFGNKASDGTFLVCGLLPEDEFFKRYTSESGLGVDEEKLKYYRIFNAYQLMVSSAASAYRVVRLGKTHQDPVVAWIHGVVYSFADQLMDEIEGF